jgi:hypothetical protein
MSATPSGNPPRREAGKNAEYMKMRTFFFFTSERDLSPRGSGPVTAGSGRAKKRFLG